MGSRRAASHRKGKKRRLVLGCQQGTVNPKPVRELKKHQEKRARWGGEMSPGEGMERDLNNAQKSPGHSAPGQTTEIPAHPPSPGRKRLHSGKSPALSPALARDHWIEGVPRLGGRADPGTRTPESLDRPSLPLPGSPKPRKHISRSTTSRCARWLGSQSAGRARGAPRTALSPSGRSPSSARASSSSSSIGLQFGTEWEAKARLERRRSRDRVRSRDPRESRTAVLT